MGTWAVRARLRCARSRLKCRRKFCAARRHPTFSTRTVSGTRARPHLEVCARARAPHPRTGPALHTKFRPVFFVRDSFLLQLERAREEHRAPRWAGPAAHTGPRGGARNPGRRAQTCAEGRASGPPTPHPWAPRGGHETSQISSEVGIPPEFKHISKGRKRN